MKFLLIAIFFVLFCTSISESEFKNNQGPADEFPEHVLPKPEDSPLISDSGIIPIYLRKTGDKQYEWTDEIPCDSEDFFSISVVSRLKDLKVIIEPKIPVEPTVTKGFFGLNKASIPTTTYFLKLKKKLFL
jgi:hypothetical protein